MDLCFLFRLTFRVIYKMSVKRLENSSRIERSISRRKSVVNDCVTWKYGDYKNKKKVSPLENEWRSILGKRDEEILTVHNLSSCIVCDRKILTVHDLNICLFRYREILALHILNICIFRERETLTVHSLCICIVREIKILSLHIVEAFASFVTGKFWFYIV